MSYICDKALPLSSICNKCGSENEKIFKEEESIEVLNIQHYFENMSQEFRFKNKNEIRYYFLDEIKEKELMSRKHKKVCTTLNYIKHFLILTSTITGCVPIFAFASLVVIPKGITNFAVGLKICAITAAIKEYESIIKKKKSMIK